MVERYISEDETHTRLVARLAITAGQEPNVVLWAVHRGCDGFTGYCYSL